MKRKHSGVNNLGGHVPALHRHFWLPALHSRLSTRFFPPSPKTQFVNPFLFSSRSLGHCLRKANGPSQRLLDSLYKAGSLSGLKITGREILDKRPVDDLAQDACVLHKHPRLGPMSGKGDM